MAAKAKSCSNDGFSKVDALPLTWRLGGGWLRLCWERSCAPTSFHLLAQSSAALFPSIFPLNFLQHDTHSNVILIQHLGIRVEGSWGPKEALLRVEGTHISRHTSWDALPQIVSFLLQSEIVHHHTCWVHLPVRRKGGRGSRQLTLPKKAAGITFTYNPLGKSW